MFYKRHRMKMLIFLKSSHVPNVTTYNRCEGRAQIFGGCAHWLTCNLLDVVTTQLRSKQAIGYRRLRGRSSQLRKVRRDERALFLGLLRIVCSLHLGSSISNRPPSLLRCAHTKTRTLSAAVGFTSTATPSLHFRSSPYEGQTAPRP